MDTKLLQSELTRQRMDMDIARWSLFREDVRDLFALTTSNMSTYMIVGTLFLGFAVTSIWNGIKDFPLYPPWLMPLLGKLLGCPMGLQ